MAYASPNGGAVVPQPAPSAAQSNVVPQGGWRYSQPAMGGKGGGNIAPTAGFNVNQAAAGGLQQAMLGTQAAAGGYTPATVAGRDLSAYTNPYENQVVQQSLGDIERSRQMAQEQAQAQGIAARAFGGSRQGVLEAETNRAYADQAARTAAGLRQAGYSQAQGLAGQDVNAINQAQQFNKNFGLSSAAQMGNLANQAFNTSQAISNQQFNQGLAQQQLQQQLINAAQQQWAGYTGAPQAGLQTQLGALQASPYGQTTTQSYTPGLFNWLSMPLAIK